MSDTIIKIIPEGIGALPMIQDEESIKQILNSMDIGYENLRIIVTEHLNFIDCGENLQYIRCTHCKTDALRWWGEKMSISADNNFENREIITPCCNKKLNLEDLEYSLESGFARFSIELRNPHCIISEDTIFEIGKKIGCKLTRINARY